MLLATHKRANFDFVKISIRSFDLSFVATQLTLRIFYVLVMGGFPERFQKHKRYPFLLLMTWAMVVAQFFVDLMVGNGTGERLFQKH